MLSLFQRKRVPPTAGTPPTSAIETPKGSMRPESAASLLASPRRRKLLEHIWQRTSLSRRQFATLYLAPLERYAELVQKFPASENHHHAYPGGMLDHGLEIVAYALKLRQSYLLPAGVTPEAQADQASVAQELGGDPSKALAAPKHALQRKLLDGLRYLLREEFKLNQAGPADGWLTQDALWLVSKTVSDKLRAHLLSQGIDGIPSSNTAVFNVLQDHGIVQPTPDGKAIWKATVTSDAGWSHAFTFLKLSPAMIWDAADRPAPFAGRVQLEEEQAVADGPHVEGIEAAPASTAPTAATDTGVAALLDLLGDTAPPTAPEAPSCPVAEAEPAPSTVPPPQMSRAPAQDRAEPSGAHFMAWLRQSIQTRKLIINDAKALVHTVAGTTYHVSP
ncbi:TraI domain-containing protein, partial [Ectopseudomonas chengduensis]